MSNHVIKSELLNKQQTGYRQTLFILFNMFWQGAKHFRLQIILSSLYITVLSLALPIAMLQVYDRIIPNQSFSTTKILIAGVLAALILDIGLRLCRNYFFSKIGRHYETHESAKAFKHVLASDIAWQRRYGASDYLDRFSAVNEIRDVYSGQSFLALFDLLFIAVYLALIGILGGILVLVPIVAIIVILFLGLITGKLLHDIILWQNKTDRIRGNFLANVFNSLSSVKTLAIENFLLRRYATLHAENIRAQDLLELRTSLVSDITGLLSQLTTVAIVAFGALLVIDNQLTIGALAACTLLAGRMLQPVQAIISFWSKFQKISKSYWQLQEIFALPLSPREESDLVLNQAYEKDNRVELPEGDKPAISLIDIDVTFDQKVVFEKLNLEIKKGEMLAVTGPNGSGKSVLLLMLSGALRPTAGDILINDEPLTQYSKAFLSNAIAYIPQHAVLFEGTILENMTLFDTAFETQALELGKQLGLTDDLNSYPLGYSTMVGVGTGDVLSRGMVQRIVIIRALARRPAILLIDEPNTAMDIASDDLFKALLKGLKGSCTCLLVSSRPSILQIADRVHYIGSSELDLLAAAESVLKEAI